MPLPTPVRSSRSVAWDETWKIFSVLSYADYDGESGKERVVKIFDRTVGDFLDNWAQRGEQKWDGALRSFVLKCMQHIVDDLKHIGTEQGAGFAGCTPGLIQVVAVKGMRDFKDLSRVCSAAAAEIVTAKEATARQGAVCDPFLDSL